VIRVIYRWRIDSGTGEDFQAWWHEGTVRIRATNPGALGSTFLRPVDGQTFFVAVARWRDREALERFWARPPGAPFPGAELESADTYDELDDLTLGISDTAPG
jgi:antibiotic biosynthesis monooxygenase (ABM) superfamily enzyme